MQGFFYNFPRTYPARFATAMGLYAVVLLASFYLIPAGGSGASIVWPASALGLVILLYWGIDLWPAIATGLFVVLLARGVYPPLIATTAVGNVTEAVAAAYLLKYYFDFSPMLSRLRDALGLALAAAAASAISASIITVGVFVFNQRPALNMALWTGLWIGHAVSLLSFGPFLIRWLYRPFFTKTYAEVLEGVTLFGIIFTLCFLLFWTPYSSVGGISLLYILIIPLIWAALRTGPRGTTLALFMLALIGATGILFGYGPVSYGHNLPQALFGIQMVVGMLSIIFLLFTSITEERKEAVNQLQGHVDQLEVALEKISSEDKAKSDFIAILAHELRNPLSPLLSGLELLKIEQKGPPEVLRMMGAHLHTVARLLDDLLDISRISQKKFKLQKEPVEIHTVLSHVLEMVQPQVEARRHTLSVSVPEEEVWLNGDPVRLAQIFVNLLNNSTKYTEPGGLIELHAQRQGDTLVVSVKDNGIGIAPERLAGVFEPFGGSETVDRRPTGLRVGLSLAKRMTEMHHGTIRAMSDGEGTGTEVVVEIPLTPTIPLAMSETARPRVRGRFSKQKSEEATQVGPLKILVVDDNEAAARGLGTLLKHYGHTVLLAYDAPEALALAREERPDVAILDIGLPTSDGYTLAKQIRESLQEPIICVALTGYGQTEDKEKAKEAGFDEHLVKPVSIVDVERVLAELHAK